MLNPSSVMKIMNAKTRAESNDCKYQSKTVRSGAFSGIEGACQIN